ncbi:MAG: response regulator [Desulfobacula sp.]|nr:response regulator [Desulfobacula sp.]
MQDSTILYLEKMILKKICSRIFKDCSLVYFITDNAGKVIQQGGNFSNLNIKIPEKESDIAEVFIFMEGIIPLQTDSMDFSCIKMPSNLCVDAHLFKTDNSYGLIVWDATKKEEYLAQTQQQNNELSLMVEKKKNCLIHPSEKNTRKKNKNILMDLAKVLDFAIMEMNDQGNFVLTGTPPPWINIILDSNQILSGQPYQEDVFNFLGNFIQEAKSRWSNNYQGSFKSGIWIEKDETGQEFLFETTAIDIDGRKLLIIAHDVCHPYEKQSIIQKGRSLALQYHSLQQADQKLKGKHDELELRVKERTKDLQEANKRLERELKEREEVSKQLRQSQKMEAIGTLSGGIAHDFNNILAGIYGYAHLAEMDLDESGQTKHYVSQVIKGAKRASALVRQILTFSRQTEHKKQLLDISFIVNDTINLLRASIPSTIEIKRKIFPQKKVMADSTQIHQVVMNLCTNAYHSMSDTGGVLEISLQEIIISDEDSIPKLNKLPGEYLKLEVSDTGCGIDDKLIEKIFDPYFTTKKQGEGTGLGLALVQAIVDDHNGFLEVDTKLNQGTKFYIFLPVIKEMDVPDTLLTKDISFLKGNEKIMIVDDEEAIRLASKDFLERYGYKINAFKNGFEALKEFKNNPDDFDLVVTDLTMPRISGDKLAIELLAIRPDLPIILCTGYSEKMTKTKAKELGIKKYIQKPITNTDLTILAREILDAR